MEQSRFDRSLQVLVGSSGRREAVRSLGAIGAALLAALGLADAAVAGRKHDHAGGNGGGNGHKHQTADRHRRGNQQQHLAQNGSVQAERKKRKTCAKSCGSGRAPAPVVREGNNAFGPGFIRSVAHCNPGENAVGGGFYLFNADLVAVVQMANAPLVDDDDVPIGWETTIENGDANKSIVARVLCVAD